MASTEHAETTGYIRDLRDGTTVDQVLLVRDRELRQTRAGAEFMTLSLSDRTGSIRAVVWDGLDRAREIVRIAEPLRVVGTFSETGRYGNQLTVRTLAMPAHVDWNRLVDGPDAPVDELERRLDELIGGLTDRHLRALVTALLGSESLTGSVYRRAFAAQYNHHAYRGGLLEHSLAVATTAGAAAASSPGTHRDLVICGALLHDIGKLDSYTTAEHSAALNDTGRLIGEIPSGYYRVRRQIDELADFPPALAEQLLHIILSHHGRLEHGSPVVPQTREALIVHAMDKLSGDLGSVDRLERETSPDTRWSRYDRALDRSVLVNPEA